MNEYQELVVQAKKEGIQRFVVAAILTHNNKTLLLKRPSDDFMAGLWELPSGKVEGEETLQEALKREVTEETGLEIQEIKSYVGSFDYTSKSEKKTRQFSFVATTKNHQPITLTEHEQHAWIQPKNLDEYNISKEVRAQLQKHWN